MVSSFCCGRSKHRWTFIRAQAKKCDIRRHESARHDLTGAPRASNLAARMPRPHQPSPADDSSASIDRLDSWKAIAAHLGRTVRTIQRWERSAGLPIRRLQHAEGASVYALL